MPKIVVVEMVGCAADSFCVEICGCEFVCEGEEVGEEVQGWV